MKRMAAFALIGVLLAGSARAEVLITEQEARSPADDSKLSDNQTIRSRDLSRPPRILVESPGDGWVKSPLNLKLKFEAYGGAMIDLSSVKVTYLRKPALDLTDRVRRFIKPDGLEMLAEMPPGEHILRVDVTDSGGHPARAYVTLKVAK